MRTPVDATTTQAWADLTRLHDHLHVDFRDWFAADPDRAKRFSLSAADLYADLSKNYITDEVRDVLVQLAEQTGVAEHRDAMLAGERINTTENRSVLHTALRLPADASLDVEGTDVFRKY